MEELQFYFPSPGNWENFRLTVLFLGRRRFVQSRRYTRDDIPSAYVSAWEAVVARLIRLEAPWKAKQVVARLGSTWPDMSLRADDSPPALVEAVELTVQAINEAGGCKEFSPADYREFTIAEAGAVAFFKYFTEQ